MSRAARSKQTGRWAHSEVGAQVMSLLQISSALEGKIKTPTGTQNPGSLPDWARGREIPLCTRAGSKAGFKGHIQSHRMLGEMKGATLVMRGASFAG